MKYHAMLSLLFDVNVPAQAVIKMSRGFGGTLRPADTVSEHRVDVAVVRRAHECAEQDMFEVWLDHMRDSGAWEP